VTGLPEAAFVNEIQNNARRTLLLCSLALVGAIGSGIWTARRITGSLLDLTKATQNIAAGDLNQPLHISQIYEIEALSKAFRTMVKALRQGAELQKNYEQDLEHQVAEKNAALNEAQRIACLGSWTFNVAEQTATLSPELCRIFGLDPKDNSAHYEKYLQSLHRDDQAAVETALETAIATGQPYTLEYRVIRPDASIRYVIGRGEAVKDSLGQVVKIVGTGLDITSQKQTEIALQQSKARLQLITDSIPGCISYIDSQQRYQFVNKTYETWFNQRREDILGSRVEEVIGPDSYARACSHIEAALSGKTVTYEMELPYQGTHSRYVSGVLVPDFGDRNTVNGYYALITDITDRKKLERALQASEQKTQEIFNSALAAIASMRVFENGTWKIDRVSAGCESLTGFTAEEMTLDNSLWIQRILPEDWDAFQQQSFTNIFAEQTGTYEYRFHHKNGGIRWFSQITNSIKDEDQQCWIVTATSIDITDRKLAEEQLIAEFQLRQAIESSIVEGITLVSLEGEQTYVNPAFCRMVGWSQQELLGAKPPFVYWPPEEVEHNTQAMHISLRSEAPPEGTELRFMKRNGEKFDVLLLDAPLRDSQGKVTAWLASIYDITERKQAENALKQSEIRFRDISASSPAIIYVLVRQPDGTRYFEHMSQAVETICEVSVAEVMEDAGILLGNIHPEDLEGYNAAVKHSETTLEPFQYEWRFITPSGKVKWMQGRSQPRWRESGALAWYGVVTDITERKVTEAKLQERENLLRAIGDNLPQGFVYQFMHEPGKGFYFNYVSAGVEKIVGLKPEEIMGNFNALGDLIVKEDRPLVEQANRESLENLSIFDVDMRKRTLWGDIQWSTVRSIPHRLEDGRTVWYGIELDITNLKKTEAALRENEELFRRAFEDAPIGMALVSVEGRFLRVNQALSQIYGYAVEELMQMSVRDISDPDDMAKDQALADQVLAGEIHTYQLEKRYIHKAGHIVYGLLNVSLLRDPQQRPLYFVTQVQDISERHKIDKMKRDFVSIVSHELRTPLTSMRGALGLLESGVLKDRPNKAQHMMSVAIQNSDRLIRLVNDILDLERLESGQVTLVRELYNIGELMASAVESLETMAVNAGIWGEGYDQI
jgi:PAS domain S-box-containing protein